MAIQDTKQQFRLTAIERADLVRAIVSRIAVINGVPGTAPALRDDKEKWRLFQLLDRFCDDH